MNTHYAFLARLTWFNLPVAVLLGVLQRTPVLRVVAAAGDRLASAPLGAMLRAATLGLGQFVSVTNTFPQQQQFFRGRVWLQPVSP